MKLAGLLFRWMMSDVAAGGFPRSSAVPFAAALVLVAAGLALYACGGSVYTAISSEDCYRVIRFAALLLFEHMKDKLQCFWSVLLSCQNTHAPYCSIRQERRCHIKSCMHDSVSNLQTLPSHAGVQMFSRPSR